MTYADFIREATAHADGYNQQDVKRVAKAIFATITEQLSKGEEVVIPDIGRFSIKEVRERKGVNPSTGQPLMIPAHKKVAFRSARQLSNSVNHRDDAEA